jgi:alkylhydroperoxidase/carboxymuconolactone decarboxylase family protein YurZ
MGDGNQTRRVAAFGSATGRILHQLPFHLKFALQNGVTREELIEVIAHLAPSSTAVAIARKLFGEEDV